MPAFIQSVIVNASVETVFAFHERDDALRLLTPPFPPVKIVSRTGRLEPGTRVELRIGFVTWVALHTAYERNRLFVDEQIRGPFAKWIHRHEFEDLGGKTRLTDRVEFRLRGGSLVNAVFEPVVRMGLARMFRYRHQVTRKLCEPA